MEANDRIIGWLFAFGASWGYTCLYPLLSVFYDMKQFKTKRGHHYCSLYIVGYDIDSIISVMSYFVVNFTSNRLFCSNSVKLGKKKIWL